jgi:hypothetical protein
MHPPKNKVNRKFVGTRFNARRNLAVHGEKS